LGTPQIEALLRVATAIVSVAAEGQANCAIAKADVQPTAAEDCLYCQFIDRTRASRLSGGQPHNKNNCVAITFHNSEECPEIHVTDFEILQDLLQAGASACRCFVTTLTTTPERRADFIEFRTSLTYLASQVMLRSTI